MIFQRVRVISIQNPKVQFFFGTPCTSWVCDPSLVLYGLEQPEMLRSPDHRRKLKCVQDDNGMTSG